MVPMPFEGQRLKDARNAAGKTQADLAALSGVSERQISRIELDKCEPNVATAAALAWALSCKIADFYSGGSVGAAARPGFSAAELEELEEVARFAVLMGVGALMPFFRAAFAPPGGWGHGNVATRGDIASTIQITRALIPMLDTFTQRRDQRCSIFAEELSSTDPKVRAEVDKGLAGLPPFWIVRNSQEFAATLNNRVGVLFDGLDGTSNFRAGLPVFCVAVAIFDGPTPRVAAIYDPIQHVCFYASVPDGGNPGSAYLWNVSSGVRQDLRSLRPTGDEIDVLCTHLPSEPADSKKAMELLDRFTGAKRKGARGQRLFDRITMLNSGQVALAYVASQSLAGFVNVSTSIWDVAAGEVLIRSLGGWVTDLEGNRIDYAAGAEKTSVVAACSKDMHDKLLDLCV
jgi:fructose-1,6-bisphosphatase/inositol monophosphatase family enzyme/DNA-binding XRE family transcriptional regulator